MNEYNVLMGAKVGDLFHSLIVPAYLFHTYNKKSNFYIAEACDKFETSLERTYEELIPIMKMQPYINKFEIYRNGIHEIDYDLNHFRSNGVGNFHANYTFLGVLRDIREFSLPYNFKYLDAPFLSQYEDYLIVSRKHCRTEWNSFVEMQYKNIFQKFDKKLFVSFNGADYNDFPLKDDLDLLVVENLYDFVSIINSCKLFLANCSGPLCFASALNAPRVGEVGDWVTARYKDDHLFSNKSEIFTDTGIIFTPHINYLVK